MDISNCYYLGTVTKKHGLKGHLVVKIDTDEPYLYDKMESVFININQTLVPFFLKECVLYNKDSLKILIEDAVTPENLIGKDLYLPLANLPTLLGNKFYYHEIINYSIKNIHDMEKEIGVIIEVNDQTAQPLFVLKNETEKELYIPIINDWIIEVKREDKLIIMNLPEGIADL